MSEDCTTYSRCRTCDLWAATDSEGYCIVCWLLGAPEFDQYVDDLGVVQDYIEKLADE
jgi:hypothetical protein